MLVRLVLLSQVSFAQVSPTDFRARLIQDSNQKYFCSYSHAVDTRCGYAMESLSCDRIPTEFNWCSDSKYQYHPSFCQAISDMCRVICNNRTWWPSRDPICWP